MSVGVGPPRLGVGLTLSLGVGPPSLGVSSTR